MPSNPRIEELITAANALRDELMKRQQYPFYKKQIDRFDDAMAKIVLDPEGDE